MKIIKRVINILKNYYQQGAFHIITSSVSSKIFGFLLSLIIIRLLDKNIYGSISYSRSIVALFIPLAGFGAMHSLLRFGSIARSNKEKNELFYYTLKNGLVFSFITVTILIIYSIFFGSKIKYASIFLIIISFQIITQFLLANLQSFKRIMMKNKEFACINFSHALIALILCTISAYFFDGFGYLISLVIVPLIIFIPYYFKIKNSSTDDIRYKNGIHIDKRHFWFYGINVSLGSLISRSLFAVDIILLGLILKDPITLAQYKVATLIPYNLAFIPQSFILADFVIIAKKYKNKEFLLNMAKKYILLFSLLIFIFIIPICLFSQIIIKLLFGAAYENSFRIMQVLLLGVAGSFIFRIPFGNILAAVGKANWNVINSYIVGFFNILMDYIFIKKYGVIGAAYATSIMIWISGLVALFAFCIYIRRINKKIN